MQAGATDRLELSVFLSRENLDLQMQAEESSAGTDFTGLPFTTNAGGPADVTRDTDVKGIDLGYTVGPRARLIAGIRSSTLDQRGVLAFGNDQGSSDWRIDTDGFELGAEYALKPNLILAGGWSGESRDAIYRRALNGDLNGEQRSTDRDGYFLRLRYDTPGDLSLSAAIEDNGIDDPFALASPTASRRYKFSLHRNWETGLSVDANLRHTDVDNSRSGWGTDTRQADFRLGYRTDSLQLGAGLGDIEVGRRIDQLVTGGTVQVLFPIDYRSDASFFDLFARWAPGRRISLGGDLRRYENRGSFPIDRDDWQTFLEITISTDYALRIDYRSIDYVEDSFDDYDADILELSARISW